VGENCQLAEPAALRPFYMQIREGEQVSDGEAVRRRWIGEASTGCRSFWN
jgi:hypothetical protein